jgi:hypothetical protein
LPAGEPAALTVHRAAAPRQSRASGGKPQPGEAPPADLKDGPIGHFQLRFVVEDSLAVQAHATVGDKASRFVSPGSEAGEPKETHNPDAALLDGFRR